MIKSLSIILVLIFGFTGCAMEKHIEKGEFYNLCQEIVTNDSDIESSNISINSQGYFDMTFNMNDKVSSNDQQYIEIFKGVSEYLYEINNGDRTFEDDQFKERGVREIVIKIIYPNDEVFSYHSHYYGGETIYSDDDLNTIDNFETWYGP